VEVGSIQRSRFIVGVLLALALLLIVNLSVSAQPSQPVQFSPDNNENISDPTPRFEWENGAGADNHRLVVDNDSNFADGENAIDNVIVGENYFITPPENALDDGVYYWIVIAENADDENQSENIWTFRVDTLGPAGPPMTYPDNGENIKDNAPNLDWTFPDENSYPLTYDVWVDDNPDFSSPVITATGITDENYQTAELSEGWYYWRVRAVDNADNPGENSENRFQVDITKPPTPSLVSPDNNENINDNTPNLDWDPVSDASEPVLYRCYVDNNSDFSSVENDSGWVENDNFQVPDELAEGVWYWRVQAKDNAGNTGDNSGTYSFTIDVSMPSPLVSPANGAITNDNTPTFTWENKVVVDNYEIWIDNDSDFSSPEVLENLEDNTYTSSELSDENYSWRVRAFNPDNSHFSEVWTLLIDTKAPPAPSSSPDDGLVTNDNTPTIDWSSVIDNSYSATGEVAGVENYEIWVDNDPDFSSTVTKENRSTNSWTRTSELAEDNYSYKIKVWDKAGNDGAFSAVWTFEVDVTPPTISVGVPSVSSTSATINWTTNEPATSQVEYGLTSGYGTTTSLVSTLTTSHSVVLSGLDSSTTYHYMVKSTDAANNTKTSDDQTFTTSALAAPTSSVNSISPYWRTSTPFTVSATASGTVDNVALYYHYSSDNSIWGDNLLFGVDNDNAGGWSWSFTADNGDGYYEFYSIAAGSAGEESAPDNADASAGVDTVAPTISSVQINGENTVTPSTSVVISIVAQDPDNLSGLDQMRFSNDNENWTDWESFALENDYVLPAGDENKRVYVKVKDNAGLESAVVDNWIVLETGVYVESLGTIAENENKLADFDQYGLLVTGINLFAKDNIDNVEVEVKVVQEKPAEVSEAAPGTATYYFEVETNAPADNLDNVEIRFDVAKSWLDNLGIGAADVKLWKLDNTDNTWQEVSTTIVDENASHVHFSATVPSLSWFAVTGEKPAAPIPYLPVVAGVIIIVVILIALIWWWKKQSLSSASSQGVGVAGESQAHPEWTLNRKEP